jgi:hypothetical protein
MYNKVSLSIFGVPEARAHAEQIAEGQKFSEASSGYRSCDTVLNLSHLSPTNQFFVAIGHNTV